MKPTNEDLARLMPEARREAMTSASSQVVDGTPYDIAEDARDVMATVIRLLAATAVDWIRVRREALRALYLCALLAWEAGRRAAAFFGGCSPEAIPAAWHINRGDRLEPVEGPTAVETPAAKHDVDALLEEAAKHTTGAKAPWSAAGVIERLVAALRAERERAERAEHSSQSRYDYWWHACNHIGSLLSVINEDQYARHAIDAARRFLEKCSPNCSDPPCADPSEGTARTYLRAVLAPFRDESAASQVVAARAFMAGEEHAPQHAPQQEADRSLAALRSIFNAIGFTLGDPRRAEDVARVVVEAKALRRMADAGMGYALEDVAKLRADLRAEDEAHAHTRARLAEVERERNAWREAREAAAGRASDALAAQNRAESEAASLRAQLADLDTAIRAIVDRVEKGRA